MNETRKCPVCGREAKHGTVPLSQSSVHTAGFYCFDEKHRIEVRGTGRNYDDATANALDAWDRAFCGKVDEPVKAEAQEPDEDTTKKYNLRQIAECCGTCKFFYREYECAECKNEKMAPMRNNFKSVYVNEGNLCDLWENFAWED